MNERRRHRHSHIPYHRYGHGIGHSGACGTAVAGTRGAIKGRDTTGSLRGKRARACRRYQRLDRGIRALLKRIVALQRIASAVILFLSPESTSETANTVNIIRRLLHRGSVDLERHDEILRDIQDVLMELRETPPPVPVSDMVRGRWAADDNERRDRGERQ